MVGLNLDKSVAVVGFHDGSAGQIDSWLEHASGNTIACFVVDLDHFTEPNIEEENKKRVCQTVDFPKDGVLKGRPLIVSSRWIDRVLALGIRKVLCLDPVNQRRLTQIEQVRDSGLQLISAIHPSALILPSAKIDDGVWINAGAIVGYKAEIKSGAILNTGVQVDHHNIIEACCQLDPGVVTAGNVVLRQCCHIHTAATLINRVEIGTNSIIGAGTVVLSDIPPNCTAVGVPARIIKRGACDPLN